MLTDEEKKLPFEYPKGHRKEELIAFCRRYHDTECPLTDAEKDLIECVAFDIGKDTSQYIIEAVTSEAKLKTYCEEHNVPMEYNHFAKKIRKFFSVLDYRKRKLEARGKYIIDSFEGSVLDMSRAMQEHVDDGWNVINVSTFCKDNAPYSVAYFQKLMPEECST